MGTSFHRIGNALGRYHHGRVSIDNKLAGHPQAAAGPKNRLYPVSYTHLCRMCRMCCRMYRICYRMYHPYRRMCRMSCQMSYCLYIPSAHTSCFDSRYFLTARSWDIYPLQRHRLPARYSLMLSLIHIS